MIAPIQIPDPYVPEKMRVLRRARRIVAAMLWGLPSPVLAEASKVSGWKGWLFAGWVVAVAALYLWAMIGK